MYQEAVNKRDNGLGTVKKQFSTYNFYMKEKLNKKWKKAKESNEKVDSSQIFKTIAKDWVNQEDMNKWYEQSQKDGDR